MPGASACSIAMLEGNRPRWGGRTSNPGGAVSRPLVGSTPIPFRQHTAGCMPDLFLTALAGLAATAEAEEARHRQEARLRQVALERARIAAHRRLGFVRLMAAAQGEGPPVEMALASARAGLGWDSETEARTRILGALRLVAAAIADRRADVPVLIVEFEAWYAGTFGENFYDLFDGYVQETPVVDFDTAFDTWLALALAEHGNFTAHAVLLREELDGFVPLCGTWIDLDETVHC